MNIPRARWFQPFRTITIAAAITVLFSATAFGQPYIVRNGVAQADIVRPESPSRMAKLAATELQTYVQRISGAKLPVSETPGDDVPLHIYVGMSAHTARLGVTDENLDHGAFRMKSGKNWLALVGNDADYVPGDMEARFAQDRTRVRKKWDRITDGKWILPKD